VAKDVEAGRVADPGMVMEEVGTSWKNCFDTEDVFCSVVWLGTEQEPIQEGNSAELPVLEADESPI
jgi:hypothetical protein